MFTTNDIGLVIRSWLEGQDIIHVNQDDGLIEGAAVLVDHIDVSDASNPILHLENGQTFTIRVIAG